MKSIFLLTGWGIGYKPLIPLAKELERLNYQVTLVDLPYKADKVQWFEDIIKQLPTKSYWVGWSLGGQLLSYLTHTHHSHCSGLITLASNPCFKERQGWSSGMKNSTFDDFQLAYQQSPELTLKRFIYMIAQGCSDNKSLIKKLQNELLAHPFIGGMVGLALLASIDARPYLTHFQKPQLHIFAEQDLLVPISCAYGLIDLLGQDKVILQTNTGHAFPVQFVKQTAFLIDNFISENNERLSTN